MGDLSLLLWPKWRSVQNSSKRSLNERLKGYFLFALAAVFCVVIFYGSYFVFNYLIEQLELRIIHWAVNKALLGLAVLTFMAVLIFSNIITALSTFFLSEDLELVGALPVSRDSLFSARFIEQVVDSSWMIVIFGTPVFLAFGAAYDAGVFYYMAIPLTLLPLVLIPAGFGIIVTMALVSAFPARRIRDILFLLILFGGAILITLFRIVRPEQMFNPDERLEVIDFIKTLQMPAELPSSWVTNILTQTASGGLTLEGWFFTALLWSTGLGMVALSLIFARFFYAESFSKSQEATRVIISRTGIFNRFILQVSRPFSLATRQMVMKDIRTFMRDTSQWSQLFLIVALIIIYIFNFKALDAGVDTRFSQFRLGIQDIEQFKLDVLTVVSYGNIGLVGFVLTALSARFVFPMVSLEGRAFWIVKSSPLSLRGFLASKFAICFVPIMLVGEALAALTNYVLGVGEGVWYASIVYVFLISFVVTGMGLGLGARYPRFHVENPAKVATGFGGVIFMIITMAVIGVMVGLIVNAMILYYLAEYGVRGRTMTPEVITWITASYVLAAAVVPPATIIPMRLGLRWLERMELG